ncbi:hypothetical protein GCM10025782_05810 [Pedococcus ginsenosidimutans]|uniref:Secreted protein n=1 Tax=Pedococcus ginsenosidimutans TaxID=490570 RepID=A0ABP8XRS5_9MICO
MVPPARWSVCCVASVVMLIGRPFRPGPWPRNREVNAPLSMWDVPGGVHMLNASGLAKVDPPPRWPVPPTAEIAREKPHNQRVGLTCVFGSCKACKKPPKHPAFLARVRSA